MRPLAESFARKARSLYFQATAPWLDGLGAGLADKPKGRCLIGYVPEGVRFIHQRLGRRGCNWHPQTIAKVIPEVIAAYPGHSMFWESVELTRQIIARGYVVDYMHRVFPKPLSDFKHYDVLIDEWNNLPEWANENPPAKKLFYSTGMEWSYWNRAELTRIHWLNQRRGVTVPPQRQCPFTASHEPADLISTFGNGYIQNTWGPHFQHKMRRLALSVLNDDISLGPKPWAEARRTFLWFAGFHWLNRGLDLVTEVFLRKPHLRLVICGGGSAGGDGIHGLRNDPYLQRLYGRELKKARNIEFLGHLDPAGRGFVDLMDRCSAVLVPTALDSCSGSVLQAMHYGLIPVTTPTAGLDLPPSFPLLPEDSDAAIMEAVASRCEELAQLPEGQLESLRREAWEFARKHYSRKAYRNSLNRLLDEFLGPIVVA